MSGDRGVDVVALRRELHRRPELGFAEICTAARVVTELREGGWQLRLGAEVADVGGSAGLPGQDVLDAAADRARSTGVPEELIRQLSGGHTAVVADLDGNRPGPTIALRFDMDALPLDESTDPQHRPAAGGYASAEPGVMHACGHDGHVAIGIALADRLAGRDFPGHVRLLFQPAEEGVRGARAMAAAGVVDGVDAFYAVHLGMGLDAGAVSPATEGRFATRKLLARFRGRAAHASGAPEQGRHALLAAATAALNIQALPRFASADTRVNVGRLVAGTAPNIIPAAAELAFEVRSTDTDVVTDLDRRARRICAAAGDMHEVAVDVVETGAADNAPCDPGPCAAVTAAAAEVAGVTRVEPTWAALGSDDATVFMAAVQRAGGVATYVALGSGDFGPHHSARFDIDDEVALPLGVDLLARLVRAGEHTG